jgi:hypothetical protein
MTRNALSNRRFFLKAGALFSAPLAVVSMAALAGDRTKVRLAQLEDERALRDLHQTWMRSVNAGATGRNCVPFLAARVQSSEDNVRSVRTDLAAAPGEITFGSDGKTAAGCFHCEVEIETPLAKTCTLGQMAHLQGNGFVRRTETGVLNIDYVKTSEVWSILRVRFAAADLRHRTA